MLQRYKNPQKVAHPRLVVSGDTTTLRQMLQQDPELVQAHSTRKHHATLLHYIAANGVEGARQKTPQNAVEVAKILLDAGAAVDALRAVKEYGRLDLAHNNAGVDGQQLPLHEQDIEK